MNTDNTTNSILLSPLPQRAVPCPDEDLLSLLRRSAAKMGYPDYRWLLRPEGNHWNIKDTDVPLVSVKWDYQIMEQLLLLTEEEVHSHTLHRFAPLLEQAHGRLQSAVPQNNSSNLMQPSSELQRIYVLPEELVQLQDLLQVQNDVAFLLFHWLFLEWPSHFFIPGRLSDRPLYVQQKR